MNKMRLTFHAFDSNVLQYADLIGPAWAAKIDAIWMDLSLVLAVIALLLRSGACLWLLLLYIASKAEPYLVTFLKSGEFGAGVTFVCLVSAGLLVVLPLILWLVRRGEIRSP